MDSITVIEKAIKLVKRLDEIHKDPLYESVWFCAFNHGIDYTHGPTYEKELAELRKALDL